MRYIIVPAKVQIKLRDGSLLRQTGVDEKSGQPKLGSVMEPMTLYDYAEAWWNQEKMAAGGLKALRTAEKILNAFDEAKRTKAAYIALEDAEWEKLKPVVETAQWFKVAPLELQCAPFIEAVLEAPTQLPAVLAPKKKPTK